MLKELLMAVALSAAAASALAVDRTQVKDSIELKDGSTVHIFKDGKMGMEDKFGRPSYMESGHAMETNDGKKIIMNGNEVWRVDELLNPVSSRGG